MVNVNSGDITLRERERESVKVTYKQRAKILYLFYLVFIIIFKGEENKPNKKDLNIYLQDIYMKYNIKIINK